MKINSIFNHIYWVLGETPISKFTVNNHIDLVPLDVVASSILDRNLFSGNSQIDQLSIKFICYELIPQQPKDIEFKFEIRTHYDFSCWDFVDTLNHYFNNKNID